MKISILLVILLTGCSFTKPDPIPIQVPVACTDPPRLEEQIMLPVRWQIAKNDQNLNVLALNGEDYSNLAINMKKIIEYMKEQKRIINYYEVCIKHHNEEREP